LSLTTALGEGAGENLTTGDNNIDIGNSGVSGESNTIRIGTQGTQTATYIAGISGVPLDSGVAVVVDATTDQLGVLPSSLRFKIDIKAMDTASEAILALSPVTFYYKGSKTGKPQFGLIAEQVEKVNSDLVARDKEGKAYSVRYDQVNAMLLNEFLKEHRKVEEQADTIADLKSTVAQQRERFQSKLAEQENQIEALASGLQEVRVQIEATKTEPQVAANRP
jgi:predicted ribosome quality control (RQC) complex YloA/Tae2 family protein